MTILTHKRPAGDFDRMVDTMERAFSALWSEPTPAPFANTIPIDIYEKEASLFVRAALPGVQPEQIDVQVEENVLTIRAEVPAAWDPADAKVYRRENRFGTFSRSLRIPEGFVLETVEASYDLGVLTLQIPKAEIVKPAVKKIEVKPVAQSAPAIEAKSAEPSQN